MAVINAIARHTARRAALHVLYQYQMTNKPIRDLAEEVLADPHIGNIDLDYYRRLINDSGHHLIAIDELISPVTDRPLADISPLELAILRIAIFELTLCLDTPYRVVLNEAIELGKKYGAEDSHKYINGVLDKLIAQLRPLEFQQKAKY
jgi:transcription antitermination protein NusB